MIASRLLLWGQLVTLGGCVVTGEIGYDCDPSIYEEGHLDADGESDFCHRREPPDAGSECAVGACTKVPLFWAGPRLLWTGPAGQAPECPTGPTGISWEGHADLVAPNECEACTCEPPTGSCALPEALTASTTACNIPGGSSASFNAPIPWDGSCDGAVQIPAGAARSLTIGALTVMENGCMPGPPVAAKVMSWYWATDARACDGPGFSTCQESNWTCTPTEDPLDFRVCVSHEGKLDCPILPDGVFREQYVFYKEVSDDRQCSACTCGPPTGSVCTAMLELYKGADLTCSGPVLENKLASSEWPVCLDFALPEQALGSKSAGPTTYAPGTCQPMGGDPNGGATEREAYTFCCRPIHHSQPAP
jgi:hypothetical protein